MSSASRYLLLAVATVSLFFYHANADNLPRDQGHSLMHTDIRIVGADESNMGMRTEEGILVDSANLIDQVSDLNPALVDVQEDPHDRFVTTRSGKPRPIYRPKQDKEPDWAGEAPMSVGSLTNTIKEPTLGRVLLRKRRCGGDDDDDDDGGDSNRARGGRWAASRNSRKVRKSKKIRKNKNKGTTTTVTKVIQNGQVVSETTSTATKHNVVAQPAAVVQQVVPGASTVHTISTEHTIKVHSKPTVHVQTTQPQAQVVQTQPQVVQTQPQVVQTQPQVVQTQPAVVQQTAAAPAVVQKTS